MSSYHGQSIHFHLASLLPCWHSMLYESIRGLNLPTPNQLNCSMRFAGIIVNWTRRLEKRSFVNSHIMCSTHCGWTRRLKKRSFVNNHCAGKWMGWMRCRQIKDVWCVKRNNIIVVIVCFVLFGRFFVAWSGVALKKNDIHKTSISLLQNYLLLKLKPKEN